MARGLSTPAVWVSTSRTVTVASSRRTVAIWSLTGASRATRPSATRHSTAVAVSRAEPQ